MSRKTNRILVNLIWMVTAIPIGSLLQAKSASWIWSWFLSSQYGPGPSDGAWFGVSLIVAILMMGVATRQDSGRDHDDPDLAEFVQNTLGSWIAILLFVLMSLAVGHLFGWTR